ncbi:unnamed protein product, partial [Rotaria sordida]
LSNDEIDLSIRIAAFGRNEIRQKPSTTFLCFWFDALKNWACITLIICGIISFVLSFYHPNGETIKAKIKPKETNVEWIEGRQSRHFQSLVELDQKCNVIRESTIQQIPIKDIVVGDICEIKYGDVLPADGVIIQSNNLKVDESSLTGESDLIEKHESTDPFLLSGTHIMEGSGKMLVLAVGEHSQTGMILKLLSTIKEQNNDKKKQIIRKNKV